MHKKNKKQYYVVKVEGLIPAEVSFRVLAENEQQAFEIFDQQPHLATALHAPRPLPGKIKKKLVTIRNTMSALITWTKKF